MSGGSGFEVQIDDLGRAAEAARSAAEQVARASPGRALSAASAAIPGAVASGLLDLVAQRWQDTLTAWAGQARAYGDNLDAAAATYRSSQDEARAAFTALDRRIR